MVAFNREEDLSAETVYHFYREHVIPSVMSTIPHLLQRLADDTFHTVSNSLHSFYQFLLPNWSTTPDPLRRLWEETDGATASFSEFMLRHFDADGDGHISPKELLQIKELLGPPSSFWSSLAREWHSVPLMDWKVGIFLWRTFGGILFLLAILSIVPGRLHALSGRILRWPVLGLTYFLIAMELSLYIVIRLALRIAEFFVARPKHRALRKLMANAKSYEEWYHHASELDRSQKRDRWLKGLDDKTSYQYNWTFIRELMKDMRSARAKGDSLLALAVIQQCTRKNVGGVMSEDLFSYSNTGEPKAIVREFIHEVVETLHWITEEALRAPQDGDEDSFDKEQYDSNMQRRVRKEKDKLWRSLFDLLGGEKSPPEESKRRTSSYSQNSSSGANDPSALPSFHREELLTFLKRARATYGRTALCLSGGAMMGCYHFGHIRGLLETGTLPNIVSGTSAGSVIGAILCTRTEEELKRDFQPELLSSHLTCFNRPWVERMKSLVRHGCMFDQAYWFDLIKWFTCGDLTFEEAYRKTGRTFCITLTSTTKKAPPVLLNHLSAPNVTIASAVVASAAVPFFVTPVRLQIKDKDGTLRNAGDASETYFDGSIQQDIPVNGLAEMLNCQFFVACQANPHIVPFFFNPKGGVGRPCRWSSGTQEDSWRGGFLLSALELYLKNDMKAKFVFLKEVDAAVGFTSTLMTQEFVGSTTIVPQVSFIDFFKLFSDPPKEDLHRYYQAGSVAAYEHVEMIKLHYKVSDALDECIALLESNGRSRGTHHRPQFMISFRPEDASEERKSEVSVSSTSTGTPRFPPLNVLVPRSLQEAKDLDGVGLSGFSVESNDEDYEDLWVESKP